MVFYPWVGIIIGIQSKINLYFHWFCFDLCGEIGVSCRNGWTIWQTRWTNIRWEPPKQPLYKVLWRGYSTDVEACWFSRQQQWNRSLPNHSWFEDKRSIWAANSQQGWDSSSCKSLGIEPAIIYIHISIEQRSQIEFSHHQNHHFLSSFMFSTIPLYFMLFCQLLLGCSAW